MLNVKIILFIVGSVFIIWVSRKSLADFRSHGFYRFIAWEAILGIILLNINYWFKNPFSILQLFAWFLLIISLILLYTGVKFLISIGKPDSNRDDPTLYELEKTSKLVTSGIYRYIRHPLYGSLLFLAWGGMFKHITIITVTLAVLATIFLVITSKIEEKENIAYFGEEYKEYMKQSRMFIPYLF